MKNDYNGLFEDWEIGVAKNLINGFRVTSKCLEKEDLDDLPQECLSHWLSARRQYDPTREASRKTFMARVVGNKLRDLAREAQADKRRAAYVAVSLGAPTGEDEDASAPGQHTDE